MYRFYIIFFSLFIFCGGVFAIAKSVKFRPWTRPGQEKAYEELLITIKRGSENPAEGALPRVECLERSFDFGVMAPMSQGSHTFKITNVGNGPLILRKGAATCICTMSDLSIVEIGPNQSHDVTLSWLTRISDRSFAHSVNVRTSDPLNSEIQLSVRGDVATLIGTTKSAIEFDGVVPDSSITSEFALFSDLWDEIEVDRIETTAPSIQCSVLPKSSDTAEVPTRSKSSVALEVRVSSLEQTLAEFLRIYVRPDPQWLAKALEKGQQSLHSLNLREDGTLLVEIPVSSRRLRRFAIYGPSIKDTDNRIINLGNHFVSKTRGQVWRLVGRVRGNIKPEEVSVTLSGMSGLSAKIEPLTVDNAAQVVGDSFRISLRIEEQLKPVIYDKMKPGKLRVDTPGLPGSESAEFDIYMVVLADNS